MAVAWWGLAVLGPFVGCGQNGTHREATDDEPAKSGDRAPSEPAPHTAVAEANATPGETFRGALRAQEEVLDGGVAAAAPSPAESGAIALEIHGEDVTGGCEVGGSKIAIRGNLTQGKVRAWLRSENATQRREGWLTGSRAGTKLSGSFRLSGPQGDPIHSGTFTANAE